ncbi:MAG: hypothetical protein R3181_13085 [Rubricoccaceae bacterium]|nr:hypothetical protein [Rubricoccaceae bacterium]
MGRAPGGVHRRRGPAPPLAYACDCLAALPIRVAEAADGQDALSSIP